MTLLTAPIKSKVCPLVIVIALAGCTADGMDRTGPDAVKYAQTVLPDSTPALTCADYLQHVQQHFGGLMQAVERNGVRHELIYVPTAMAACRGGSSTPVSTAGADQYILRFGRSRQADGMDSLHVLDGLPFEQAFVEVVGGDTVPCAFAHGEPAPTHAPFTTVVIGFDHPQDAHDRTVVLRDAQGTLGGDLVFEFRQDLFLDHVEWMNDRNR